MGKIRNSSSASAAQQEDPAKICRIKSERNRKEAEKHGRGRHDGEALPGIVPGGEPWAGIRPGATDRKDFVSGSDLPRWICQLALFWGPRLRLTRVRDFADAWSQ
jgi:hypothetical protein